MQVAGERVGKGCSVGDAVVLAVALALTDVLRHLLSGVYEDVLLLEEAQEIVDHSSACFSVKCRDRGSPVTFRCRHHLVVAFSRKPTEVIGGVYDLPRPA